MTSTYIYFIDRALSESVGYALQKAGRMVEFHKDHFPSDCPDTIWLPEVGKKGWIVLTKDKRIAHNPEEITLIAKGNVRAFILTAGNVKLIQTIDPQSNAARFSSY